MTKSTKVSIIYRGGEVFQSLSTLLYTEASEAYGAVYLDMWIAIVEQF